VLPILGDVALPKWERVSVIDALLEKARVLAAQAQGVQPWLARAGRRLTLLWLRIRVAGRVLGTWLWAGIVAPRRLPIGIGLVAGLFGLPVLLGRSGVASAEVLAGGATGSGSGFWGDVSGLAGVMAEPLAVAVASVVVIVLASRMPYVVWPHAPPAWPVRVVRSLVRDSNGRIAGRLVAAGTAAVAVVGSMVGLALLATGETGLDGNGLVQGPTHPAVAPWLAGFAVAGVMAFVAGLAVRRGGTEWRATVGAGLVRMGAVALAGVGLAFIDLWSKVMAHAHRVEDVMLHAGPAWEPPAALGVAVLAAVSPLITERLRYRLAASSRWVPTAAGLVAVAFVGVSLGNGLDAVVDRAVTDFIDIPGVGVANVADLVLVSGLLVAAVMINVIWARAGYAERRSGPARVVWRAIHAGVVQLVVILGVTRVLLALGDSGAGQDTLPNGLPDRAFNLLLIGPLWTVVAVGSGIVAGLWAYRADRARAVAVGMLRDRASGGSDAAPGTRGPLWQWIWNHIKRLEPRVSGPSDRVAVFVGGAAFAMAGSASDSPMAWVAAVVGAAAVLLAVRDGWQLAGAGRFLSDTSSGAARDGRVGRFRQFARKVIALGVVVAVLVLVLVTGSAEAVGFPGEAAPAGAGESAAASSAPGGTTAAADVAAGAVQAVMIVGVAVVGISALLRLVKQPATSLRRSVVALLNARLSRQGIARLLGTGRRSLRRWLDDTDSSADRHSRGEGAAPGARRPSSSQALEGKQGSALRGAETTPERVEEPGPRAGTVTPPGLDQIGRGSGARGSSAVLMRRIGLAVVSRSGLALPVVSAAVVMAWAGAGVFWPVPAVVGFVAFVAWGALDVFTALRWDTWPAVGRVFAGAVALNWLVDLAIDFPAAVAGDGFAAWVGAVFAVADVSFLVAAVPAAWAAWFAVEDLGRRPLVLWVQRWLAFPSVTVAIGLLGLQMVLEGRIGAAVALAATVAGFAYQTGQRLRAAQGAGVGGTSGRTAMFIGGVGLGIYGMLRLAFDQPVTAVVTGAVVAATAMLLWVLNRRGPPPRRTVAPTGAPGGIAVGTADSASGSPAARADIGRLRQVVRAAIVLGVVVAVLVLAAGSAAAVGVLGGGAGASAAASDDRHRVKVHDLRTGSCLHALEGHGAPLTALRIAADNRFAVSASEDATLRIWDLTTGRCLHTVDGLQRAQRWLDLSGDGHTVLTADGVDVLRWELDWDYEFPAGDDWDPTADRHLAEFLARNGTGWSDADLAQLHAILCRSGFGWLEVETVRAHLREAGRVARRGRWSRLLRPRRDHGSVQLDAAVERRRRAMDPGLRESLFGRKNSSGHRE
jgi:hypothetical protein